MRGKRAWIAAGLVALLPACDGQPAAAPSPSQTTPARRTPQQAVGGIAAALRAAGSSHVNVQLAVGTSQPSYTGYFDVLFRTGAFSGGFNTQARRTSESTPIRRIPPDVYLELAGRWVTVRAAAGERQATFLHEIERFVRTLSLPGCAVHLAWTRAADVRAILLAHETRMVATDVYEGDVPVAACVPMLPEMLETPPATARIAVYVGPDGLPVRYEAQLAAETLTIGFWDYGTIDAVQPPPGAGRLRGNFRGPWQPEVSPEHDT